jgi:hypothetical protein
MHSYYLEVLKRRVMERGNWWATNWVRVERGRFAHALLIQ